MNNIVKTRFDENKSLYKKLYGFDFGEDLSVFDIIINTDDLDAETVLNMAKQKVREIS